VCIEIDFRVVAEYSVKQLHKTLRIHCENRSVRLRRTLLCIRMPVVVKDIYQLQKREVLIDQVTAAVFNARKWVVFPHMRPVVPVTTAPSDYFLRIIPH